ncbi:hypothetical protein [Brevundimonas poindexterae]|uniref:hypothetical protein n=1 Tax=Brevundimonas poindexterae TaxID=74325 RepID=UPI001CFD7C3D|nr:hypothetical protein [Brevundimonas poindexterae]
MFDREVFNRGRALRQTYRPDGQWTGFLCVVGAVFAVSIIAQLAAAPSWVWPGMAALYPGSMASCVPDGQQAGMMISRSVAALSVTGGAIYYLIRIWRAGAAGVPTRVGIGRRPAYTFVVFLVLAILAFALPENHRGVALGCDDALRDPLFFWLMALAATAVAAGCQLFTDALHIRPR